MEFAHTDRARHARGLVFTTHRDEVEAVAAGLEGVSRVELRSKTRHAGGREELVHRWHGTHAALPGWMRTLVPEELLVWTQRTIWNNHTWEADWVVDVPGLGAALECSGKNAYFEDGTGTRIEVTGDFAFKPERVPQLKGVPSAMVPVVERAVVALIKPLIERSGGAVARYLDERYPP